VYLEKLQVIAVLIQFGGVQVRAAVINWSVEISFGDKLLTPTSMWELLTEGIEKSFYTFARGSQQNGAEDRH
jgi:hypothetical protein